MHEENLRRARASNQLESMYETQISLLRERILQMKQKSGVEQRDAEEVTDLLLRISERDAAISTSRGSFVRRKGTETKVTGCSSNVFSDSEALQLKVARIQAEKRMLSVELAAAQAAESELHADVKRAAKTRGGKSNGGEV